MIITSLIPTLYFCRFALEITAAPRKIARAHFRSASCYFVRSGYVHISTGRAWYLGPYGYEWVASAASKRNDGMTSPSAYNLHFEDNEADPSYGPNSRWNGFPLRWLGGGGDEHIDDHTVQPTG